ncbi:MAG: hypothetical protein ABFC24_04035 [Methanoregulaceae archaeon]
MTFVRSSLLGKISRISQVATGSDIVLELDDTHGKITLSATKNVAETFNLKPGSPAQAVFFSPWENSSPNTGQKMATVCRPKDHAWVTILYGTATPEEIEKIRREYLGTPSKETLEAWSYLYRTPDEFAGARDGALWHREGCAANTCLQQVETVLQLNKTWTAFRYGPWCEARIRNSKRSFSGTPSAMQEAIWLHGFCNPGEYNEETRRGETIADGPAGGPFLAGFLYDGPARPDPYFLPKPPQKNYIRPIPVNIYAEQKKGKDTVTVPVGQARVTGTP